MPEPRHTIESRLRQFGRVRLAVANATLGLGLSRWGLAGGVIALLLLAGWIGQAFVNLAVAAALLVVLLVLAGRFVTRRQRFRSLMSEAFQMEELAGDLNTRVVSALDFLESGLDTGLTRVVVSRAVADVALPHEEKLDRAPRNRHAKQAAAWLLLLLVLGVTPWVGFASAWRTLSVSWRDAMDTLFPVHYVMTPEPGAYIHRVGETVELALQLSKPLGPEALLLQLDPADEDAEPVETKLAFDANARAATAILGETPGTHDYFFRFGERETGRVRLTFAELPVLVNMQTELIYPSYTRLLPRTLEGVQSRILGLQGTQMSLGFTFSKELRSATITWDDGSDLPLEVLGRYASVSLIHNAERQATLQVEDIHGFALEYPVVIAFELQLDERPEVALLRHLKDDMPLLPEMVAAFAVGANARDDYGISRCVLSWQKVTVDNPTLVRETGEVERLISPPRRKVSVNFEQAFASMSLAPGDKIVFKIDVFDNRTPDAQRASTPRRSFFVYQQELDELSIKDLGFGSMRLGSQRINKAKRATTVKAPPGLRNSEKVYNEFEAAMDNSTRAPNVRGEFRDATQDYFQVLSKVRAGSDAATPSGAGSGGADAVPPIPGAEAPEPEE